MYYSRIVAVVPPAAARRYVLSFRCTISPSATAAGGAVASPRVCQIDVHLDHSDLDFVILPMVEICIIGMSNLEN